MSYSTTAQRRLYTVVYRVEGAPSSGTLKTLAVSADQARVQAYSAIKGAGIEGECTFEHVIEHEAPKVIVHVDGDIKRVTADSPLDVLEVRDDNDSVAAELADAAPSVLPVVLTEEGEKDASQCITAHQCQVMLAPIPVRFAHELLSDRERSSEFARRCAAEFDGERVEASSEPTASATDPAPGRQERISALIEDYADTVRQMAADDDTGWVEMLFRYGWTALESRSDAELEELYVAAGLATHEEEA